jgi:hypothetical protein
MEVVASQRRASMKQIACVIKEVMITVESSALYPLFEMIALTTCLSPILYLQFNGSDASRYSTKILCGSFLSGVETWHTIKNVECHLPTSYFCERHSTT